MAAENGKLDAPEAHEAEPGVVGPEAKETHGVIDSDQNGSAFGRA